MFESDETTQEEIRVAVLDSIPLFDLETAIAVREANNSRIETLKDEAREKFRQRVAAEAKELGIDVKINLPRAVLPPRYRHPDDETKVWSGRGKPPKWFDFALKSGINAEEMRIPEEPNPE